VRFLIDTHFHCGHVNGNQAFGPAVDIIGHEYTRRRLAGDVLERGIFADLLKGMPKQLDDQNAQAAGEQDAAAKRRASSSGSASRRWGGRPSAVLPILHTASVWPPPQASARAS
jgi:hypothetical protein